MEDFVPLMVVFFGLVCWRMMRAELRTEQFRDQEPTPRQTESPPNLMELQRWHDAYDEATLAGRDPAEAAAFADSRPGGSLLVHRPSNDYQVFGEVFDPGTWNQGPTRG